jgi:predicted cation transporter
MSVDATPSDARDRWSATDTVAGLLAMIAIVACTLGLAWRPVRVIPFAVVLTLIAARMSERQQRLVTAAVVACVIGWTAGMAIAVITERPLY